MKTVILAPLMGCLILMGMINADGAKEYRKQRIYMLEHSFEVSDEELEAEKVKFENQMDKFDNLIFNYNKYGN